MEYGTITPLVNKEAIVTDNERKDEMSYISAAEAAEILGVSKRRVLQFIEDGRLTASKIGNVFALNRADVEQFAETERQSGRPPKTN